MMKREAAGLAAAGSVTGHELERCMNRFESTFNFSNIGYQSRAANLAMAFYHGEDINATVTDRRRLTVAGLQRTAAPDFPRHAFGDGDLQISI